VLEGDRIVGIIDESDVLHAVYGDDKRFGEKVAAVMTTRLQTVAPLTPIKDLFGIYEQGMVPIVVEDQKFLGLITRIDLLNYLRRRLKK